MSYKMLKTVSNSYQKQLHEHQILSSKRNAQPYFRSSFIKK